MKKQIISLILWIGMSIPLSAMKVEGEETEASRWNKRVEEHIRRVKEAVPDTSFCPEDEDVFALVSAYHEEIEKPFAEIPLCEKTIERWYPEGEKKWILIGIDSKKEHWGEPLKVSNAGFRANVYKENIYHFLIIYDLKSQGPHRVAYFKAVKPEEVKTEDV